MRCKQLYLILLAIPMLMSSCYGVQASPPPPLTGQLLLDVVHAINAGEPLRVVVKLADGSEHADGSVVTLIAVGSYGPHIQQTTFHHSIASFLFPAQEMQQSGQLSLIARAGDAQGDASVIIKPGNPVAPLTPLIGARSIIADDSHWSMVVVVPSDVYGNPVVDGTAIQVRILQPDNSLEIDQMATRNLLAWMRITSDTKAGRAIIAVQAGNVHGPGAVLLETAGWPVPFQIFSETGLMTADGNQLINLYTSSIQDKFGNVMPDGTLITFVVSYPSGQITTIPADTIGGVAQTVLQAPQQPGTLDIYATVLGVESSRLQVAFSSGLAVAPFSIVIQKSADKRGYDLIVGPLLGTLGEYVPNGTPVYFQLVGPHGASFSLDGLSQNGYASAEVRSALYPPGAYTVTALVGSAKAQTTLKLP